MAVITPRSDLDFEDRIAVVTGGASGIGRATAVALTHHGARVALLDNNAEAGQQVCDELNVLRNGSALFCLTDISDASAVDRSTETVVKTFGGIDLLAHCAGTQTYGSALTTSSEAWDRTLAVDLDGAFYVARAILPHMQRCGRGSIVFVGSTQSVVAHRNSAAYVTGKHAILGLTRSIALDFAQSGVRCNSVLPGAIDTPMIHWGASRDPNPQKVLDACASLALLGRMGTAEEVANVILFMLSDMASFVTGSSIVVDGGQLVPCGGTAFQLIGTGGEPQ